MTSRIVLIGGGVRSGKSAFALDRAKQLGERRLFIATAQAFDEEMRRRIAAHVEERGQEFVTIEAPRDIERVIENAHRAVDVIVLDCLTLWLSNLLLARMDDAAILQRIRGLAELLAQRHTHAVLITNEVGMGVVPETPLGRAFRDLSGRAHQILSSIADELYLGTMGVILRLRPAPVEIVERTADA